VFPELQTVGDVDYAMINLRFKNGGLGNVEVSRDAIYGYDIQCEIIGEQGTLKVGYLQHTPIVTVTKGGVNHDIVPHFPQRFGKAYTNQVEHFVECLRAQKSPVCRFKIGSKISTVRIDLRKLLLRRVHKCLVFVNCLQFYRFFYWS
jgi:predicted dehydrogenase